MISVDAASVMKPPSIGACSSAILHAFDLIDSVNDDSPSIPSFSQSCPPDVSASELENSQTAPLNSTLVCNEKPTPPKTSSTPRFYKKKVNTSSLVAAPTTHTTPRKEATSKNMSVMSPNTRQRKKYIVDQIVESIRNHTGKLKKRDQVDVLFAALGNLGVQCICDNTKRKNSGRKMTPLAVRKRVWDFWHQNSTPSTITSRPAKLKLSDRHHIQSGLDFVDTATEVIQHKRTFKQSHWFIMNDTLKNLWVKYLKEYPDTPVSKGTFIALMPFYVRSATAKDLAMCVCKKHLHARWSISALIDCASKQKIVLPFKDYTTFFEYLTSDCKDCRETTYIKCDTIATKWNEFKQVIITADEKKTTVNMQHFETVEKITKKGKITKRLVAKSSTVGLPFIMNFISERLSKIINHRNHLKHYRNTIKEFREHFHTISLDIDFSENLSIPVQFEPQSLHWSHEQVTVHSGILKCNGVKSYHPYISDDKKHDQQFVHIALNEMLSEAELPTGEDAYIVIESDNCTSQYKSAAHFHSIQQISNEKNIKIVRVYSIAEHGKGEVDHVGGVAKTAIRRDVEKGVFFENAEQAVHFLQLKFHEHCDPSYYVKEIKPETIQHRREEVKLDVYNSIDGSNYFQVMVFKPHEDLRAAPRICLCDDCKKSYGSCSLFSTYSLNVGKLKGNTLRSAMAMEIEYDSDDNADNSEDNDDDDSNEVVHEFLLPGSVCAIAASKNSTDTVWFFKIIYEGVAEKNIFDDDGHCILEGNAYIGHYLEYEKEKKSLKVYKERKKAVYCYRSSVVYPFVQYMQKGDIYHIKNEDFCDVISYVQHNGLQSL